MDMDIRSSDSVPKVRMICNSNGWFAVDDAKNVNNAVGKHRI